MKGLRTLEPVDFFKETRKIRVDSKLNPEISNAIKRQRETVGVDYWRTTPNCKIPLSRAQKRSTIDKMHNLKFDFPNGMLPVIPQAHKSHRAQVSPTARLKKKMSSMGLNDFKRSNSDMSLSVPRISNANRILTPKPAYVTDLTCLQLADTLLSKTSVHSTNFDFSIGKTRYMNYLIEMDRGKSPKESETLPSIMNVPMTSLTNATSEQDTSGSIKINGTNLIDSIAYFENFVVGGHEGRRSNQGDVLAGENTGETKHRSILKSPNSGKNSLNVNKKNTFDMVDTVNEYSNQECDTSQYSENSASGIDRTTYITVTSGNKSNCVNCGVSVVTGNDERMGRSVRFSVSDEVYEYTPSEPICV